MQAEQAAPQPDNPWLPPGTTPLVWDDFTAGINTNASRPGIGDKELYWCDGFMPIGKNNLRTMPDVGPPIYMAPIAGSIVCYGFANIGPVPIAIVFLSDGSVIQVATQTSISTQIAPSGTIQNPSVTGVGINQWGSLYVVIVANQTNGYWLWDGSELYDAGTIGPIVDLVNSGSNYTSQPTFTLQTTGSGSGAQFSADIKTNSIDQITVTNPGVNFGPDDFAILSLSGGGSDTTAQITANVVNSGPVLNVIVLNGGKNYADTTTATLTGGGGSGASVVVQTANGAITAITVISEGSLFTSAPTITLANTGSGSGFLGQVIIGLGSIGSTSIPVSGSGYTGPPTLTVIGDGQGAQLSAVINSTGIVTQVVIQNPGYGYTKALVQVNGGNNAAEANISLMPFGISGTNSETYLDRNWIINGSKLLFTAPESLTDFATSDGGGVSQSTDSFLRVSYIGIKQTNGFLYLIGDSSVNYISSVNTAGSPPTTTFNNQNADPEIGTSWPPSVQVFSRNIVFANSFGIHVSFGGAVTKISENLDGVYSTVPNFGGITPSSAKAIVYGKRLYMVLIPVVDFITGQQVNKLFIWNGKAWWSSQQSIPLNFIAAQEINSVLTAYGTDGTGIYPLFQNPSSAFTKTIQSKLWDQPGTYIMDKTSTRLWGLTYYYSLESPELQISIDNQTGAAPNAIKAGPTSITVLNVNTENVVILNAANDVVPVFNSGVGVVVFGPTAVGQQGVVTGMTLSTNAADMAVISLTLGDEVFSYRG